MSRLRFSANLGYLWTELPLADAIRAAHRAGFDAVEIQWPEGQDIAAASAALAETGLPMVGVNTTKGDVGAGEFGLAALPGRGAQARDAVAASLALAGDLGAGYVHVLAGRAEGTAAHAAFLETLAFAAGEAAKAGRTIVIEAINPHDVPGYFLNDTGLAEAILAEVGAPNLKLLFDCYHVGRMGGDVIGRLEALFPLIHHVQIASVPERIRPDRGALDYTAVFAALRRLGWGGFIGAEYRPEGPTEASLGWMDGLRG